MSSWTHPYSVSVPVSVSVPEIPPAKENAKVQRYKDEMINEIAELGVLPKNNRRLGRSS